MKEYKEWSSRKRIIDEENKFATCYQNTDGSLIYIEPGFYTTFTNFCSLFPEHKEAVLNLMDEISTKYGIAVFTSDDEEPFVKIDEDKRAVFLNITDLANRLHIIIDHKSRGSDYGD